MPDSTSRDLPVTVSYPARYKDRLGEERTTILNDGRTLTMVVRGVQFRGNDFDDFEPQVVSDPMQLSSFLFLKGSLSSCVIEVDIPIPLVTPNGEDDGLMTFERNSATQRPPARWTGKLSISIWAVS